MKIEPIIGGENLGLDEHIQYHIDRIKVFGGWMVTRTSCIPVYKDPETEIVNQLSSTSIFVSDPNHEWVLSELE